VKNSMRTIVISEEQARAFDVCVACGRVKHNRVEVGSPVVCWTCFKAYPVEPGPLKYSELDFEEWQKRLPGNEAIERLMALTFGGYHPTALRAD
jgi:hypothetical protein